MCGKAPPGLGFSFKGPFPKPCQTGSLAFSCVLRAVVLRKSSNGFLGSEGPNFPAKRSSFLRPTPMSVSTSSALLPAAASSASLFAVVTNAFVARACPTATALMDPLIRQPVFFTPLFFPLFVARETPAV